MASELTGSAEKDSVLADNLHNSIKIEVRKVA